MPRPFGDAVLREAPILSRDTTVREALRAMLDAEVPAAPVVDERGRFAGIFGEREFLTALFPAYLNELSGAHFVRRSLDDDLDRRSECAFDPVGKHMNTEHIEVDEEYSDAEIAEIFLHHRVLLIPVLDPDRRPVGVILRRDFFRAMAERFLETAAPDHGA
jgi:CBS domain-containing protein